MAGVQPMTGRGMDFLEGWMGANVPADAKPADAYKLASQLIIAATMAGFTLADLEIDSAENFIREALEHGAEPGMPGD